MKPLLLLSYLLTLAGNNPEGCNKNRQAGCYQGRLEVQGLCGNLTVSVPTGNLPGTQPRWTDPNTGKTYTHVFRVANPCALPDSLQAGSTFYFVPDTTAPQDCNTCMAYYPTPEAKFAIRVVPGPCR